MSAKCLSCGCTELIGDVVLIDNYYKVPIDLRTFENPDAILFKGTRRAGVSAKVCTACGLVMLFTDPTGVANLRVQPPAPGEQ